jgi:hypothetical protein
MPTAINEATGMFVDTIVREKFGLPLWGVTLVGKGGHEKPLIILG